MREVGGILRGGRGMVTILAAACLSGCAVHYYDAKTGTEHLWGFGHLAMKVSEPSEGVRAIVTGTDVAGVGVGRNKGGGYATIGWHRGRYLVVMDDDAAVRFEWPRSSFLAVRVGSRPPFLSQEGRDETTQRESAEASLDESDDGRGGRIQRQNSGGIEP